MFEWLVTVQGGSCGFGMRGQKSRSGSGTRPGFEGGQTPLYRQMPKLKGIAGGARLLGPCLARMIAWRPCAPVIAALLC